MSKYLIVLGLLLAACGESGSEESFSDYTPMPPPEEICYTDESGEEACFMLDIKADFDALDERLREIDALHKAEGGGD